jgi:hypothetical protein
MKNANTLELKNAWVCEVMDLPPLIVMGNKKKVLVLKIKEDHFEHMIHRSPVSRSLFKLDVLVSLLF